jgi:AcrR family transcriptional regulator
MESKQDRILRGALDLFSLRGFHGTPVPEIARAAGVAVGTIYRYFPTKEALARALIVRCEARFDEEVFAAIPIGASPRAVFRLYWRRMVEFAKSHPAAQRFLDLQDHSTYCGAMAGEGGRALLAAVRELIARGRREGTMKPLDPVVLVALLKGALAGLARHAAGDGPIPTAMAEEMEDCLWNAVAARS